MKTVIKTTAGLVAVFIGVIPLLLIPDLVVESTRFFIIELSGCFLAFTVAILAFNLATEKGDAYYRILIFAFLIVGIADLLSAMIAEDIIHYQSNIAIQYIDVIWTVSRILFGLVLLVGLINSHKGLSSNVSFIKTLCFYPILLAAVILVVSLPPIYDWILGSISLRIWEIPAAILYLLCFILILKLPGNNARNFYLLPLFAIGIISQALMLFPYEHYSNYFDISRAVNIVGYLSIVFPLITQTVKQSKISYQVAINKISTTASILMMVLCICYICSLAINKKSKEVITNHKESLKVATFLNDMLRELIDPVRDHMINASPNNAKNFYAAWEKVEPVINSKSVEWFNNVYSYKLKDEFFQLKELSEKVLESIDTNDHEFMYNYHGWIDQIGLKTIFVHLEEIIETERTNIEIIQDNAHSKLNLLLILNVGIMLIIVPGILVYGKKQIQGLVQPIVYFKDKINRIKAGDREGRVDIISDNEIGALSNAFNEMLDTFQKSEDSFSDLFNNSNDLIHGFNAVGKILFVNKSWKDVLEYEEDDLINLSVYDIIPPKYKEEFLKTMKSVIAGGKSSKIETVYLTKSGKLIYLEGNLSCQVTNEEFASVRAIFSDISDRKKKEEQILVAHNFLEKRVKKRTSELKAAGDELRQLIDRVNAPIFGMDENCRINEWNDMAEEVTGLTKSEVMGKDFISTIISEDFKKAVSDILMTAINGKETSNFEIPLSTKDKRRAIVLFNACPRFGTDNVVTGVLCVVQDITARIAAEEKQREINRRYAQKQAVLVELANQTNISEKSRDVIFNEIMEITAETIGVKRASIWFYDETDAKLICEDLYDIELGEHSRGIEFLIESFPIYFDALKNVEWAIVADDALENQIISEFRDSYLKPNNIVSKLDLPIRLIGETIGVLCIEHTDEIRNWTRDEQLFGVSIANILGLIIETIKRKKLEDDLKDERNILAKRVEERTADLSAANAELARGARMKDEFLAGMSHELRTPLAAILGISESLSERIYGDINDKQVEQIKIIEESGSHLLSLINDILDLSKVEAGKMELEMDSMGVSVVSLCETSLQFIKQMASRKEIKVSFSNKCGIDRFEGDERRLKQALVNLLTNSVKFTPKGNSIGLDVTTDPECKQISFMVWDTGIGIADEDMDKLFRPFVQLDSKLSRDYSGTGLGLSLVSRLVELHGGGVSLKSELNKGSQITITIPVIAYNDISKTNETMPDICGSLSLNRALIFKDSRSLSDEYARYLSMLKIANITRNIGELAVEYAINEEPDLIILDIEHFDNPGWEVLELIKYESRIKNIPIIVISVINERRKGLELGASCYLVKPITFQDFQSALLEIFPDQTDLAKIQLIPDMNNETENNEIPKPIENEEVNSLDDRPLILLVDDNEKNISTTSDYLIAKKYRVIAARNGREGIERAIEIKPSIILMDIQMPVMDGLEAMQRIRTDPKMSHIPIIALTALAMKGDRERCLEAGANEYLSKPLRLKELVSKIEEILNVG